MTCPLLHGSQGYDWDLHVLAAWHMLQMWQAAADVAGVWPAYRSRGTVALMVCAIAFDVVNLLWALCQCCNAVLQSFPHCWQSNWPRPFVPLWCGMYHYGVASYDMPLHHMVTWL